MRFSLPSIKCSAAPPSFRLWCLNCTRRFDLITASSLVVGSWGEPPNIWLTVAKNPFVGWDLNCRVRMLLKSAVINDRWEVLRNLILDQSGQLRSRFKASCSGKMLQLWDLWARIHPEENLHNEFHLWGTFVIALIAPPVEKCCRDTLQTNGDIPVHVLYDVSRAPRDREKDFVKGEAPRLLRRKSSIKTLKTLPHLKNKLWKDAIHKILLKTHPQKWNIKKGHYLHRSYLCDP